jgi:hypothetical protein
MKKTITGLIIELIIWIVSFNQIAAQTNKAPISSSIAQRVEIKGENVLDGSVTCTITGGLGLCAQPYSPSMYGVVSDNPTANIDLQDVINGRYVVTDGLVGVRINNTNGNITKGDFVTSSDTPGVAVKATENGYVLGTVMQDVNMDISGEAVVMIALNIHPEAKLSNTRSNLITVIRDASKAPILEPLASFRYVLAAILVVVSFSLGFIYFGRMANTGVEAIGRNPLAESAIRRNVVLHVFVTLVIILVGLFSAYLVLIL